MDEHMTTPSQTNDAGSQTPLHKTTVKNVSAPGSANTVSAQKKGLGGVLAWLTIPGLVLLVAIIAYFVLSALKSNTEQDRSSHRNVTHSVLIV